MSNWFFRNFYNTYVKDERENTNAMLIQSVYKMYTTRKEYMNNKRDIVMIQSIGKMYIAKKNFINDKNNKLNKIIIIQRWWRHCVNKIQIHQKIMISNIAENMVDKIIDETISNTIKYNGMNYNDMKYDDLKYDGLKYDDMKYDDMKYNDLKYNIFPIEEDKLYDHCQNKTVIKRKMKRHSNKTPPQYILNVSEYKRDFKKYIDNNYNAKYIQKYQTMKYFDNDIDNNYTLRNCMKTISHCIECIFPCNYSYNYKYGTSCTRDEQNRIFI